MQPEYFYKPSTGEPLFPDMLWSRPENRLHAGKLLIIGGNAHGFAAVAEAYSAASRAGIGTARVLLPDAIQKTVGPVLEQGEFTPSTPSGSFSQKAFGELVAMSGWADGILVAGDVGRNSETAILLEKFATTFHGPLTVTKDAADYFTSFPLAIKNRRDTTMVISFAQLQRLGTRLGLAKAFTFDMGLLQLVGALHECTDQHAFSIVVKHLDSIFVASGGKVSQTKLSVDLPIWRVQSAAFVATWSLQNPSKTFMAMTTGIHQMTTPPGTISSQI
jgi:hypothetical protein